jgi:hypothetical protein
MGRIKRRAIRTWPGIMLTLILPVAIVGCGLTEPATVIEIGGVVQVIDLAVGREGTLIAIQAIVDGRVVGEARVPQGVTAVHSLAIRFEEVKVSRGQHRVGVRILDRRPGPDPLKVYVAVQAVERGPGGSQLLASGAYEGEAHMDVGDTLEFTFVVE